MTSNTTLTLAYWRKRMLAHGRPHADTTALRAETAEKQGLGPDTTSDKNSLRGRKAARAQEAQARLRIRRPHRSGATGPPPQGATGPGCRRPARPPPCAAGAGAG
ncbi:unnamed protein product, partial [Prorocentrum cordatum]